jgi:hypothetical protein
MSLAMSAWAPAMDLMGWRTAAKQRIGVARTVHVVQVQEQCGHLLFLGQHLRRQRACRVPGSAASLSALRTQHPG